MNTIARTHSAEAPVAAATERPRFVVSPAVDIVETPTAYVLTADVPGVREEDIEVTVERNLLTLSARRPSSARAEHRRLLGELVHGDYRRSFTLPERIDRDAIVAALKNGVLTLTVPKAPALLPRRITVQAAA